MKTKIKTIFNSYDFELGIYLTDSNWVVKHINFTSIN